MEFQKFNDWLKEKLKNETTDTGDVAHFARPVGGNTKLSMYQKPKSMEIGKKTSKAKNMDIGQKKKKK